MTQFALPSLVPTTDDGVSLSSKFNGAIAALYSNHQGVNPPPSPTEGMTWADTSQITASPKLVTVRTFQAGAWYALGTLNLDTNVYSVTGGLSSGGGSLTGPILFPDGTEAAPSISFSGDTDTGVYRTTSNELGFTLGGVQAARLAAGQLSVIGNFRINRTVDDAYLYLDAPSSKNRMIFGRTGSSTRWTMALGSLAPETGDNSGSDFSIARFADAGTSLGAAFNIKRSTGDVEILNNLTMHKNIILKGDWPAYIFEKKAGQEASILTYKGGNLRWAVLVGDSGAESGGNAGTNFTIGRYNDAGQIIDAPFAIIRQTGQVISGNVTLERDAGAGIRINQQSSVSGYFYATIGVANVQGTDHYLQAGHSTGVWAGWRLGTGGGYFEYQNNSTILRSIDGATVQFNPPSDERIKKNIVPTQVDALGALLQVQVSEFDYDPPGPEVLPALRTNSHVRLGFVAQQVEPYTPEAAMSTPSDLFPDGLKSVNNGALVPYLVRALQQQQELIASMQSRLDVLEGNTP
jgi:hypothetical protein